MRGVDVRSIASDIILAEPAAKCVRAAEKIRHALQGIHTPNRGIFPPIKSHRAPISCLFGNKLYPRHRKRFSGGHHHYPWPRKNPGL